MGLTDLQFTGTNKSTLAENIYTGPTSTVVVDGQRMFWLAGKVSEACHLQVFES